MSSLAATARELLGGGVSWMVFREIRMLERLLGESEPIAAMVVGRLRGAGVFGAQRLVVATSERVLLVEKGLITGRERKREIPWSAIRDVAARPPTGLDLVLDDERVELHLAQPPRQIAAVAEAFRARRGTADRTAPTVDELLELGRRKLGRMMAFGAEAHPLTLAGALRPQESVLALGFANGLVAATTERLVFIPDRGVGVGEMVAMPHAEIRRADVTDRKGLAVGGTTGELEIDTLVPEGSAESIVQIVRARA
jgi:hypothetical protein